MTIGVPADNFRTAGPSSLGTALKIVENIVWKRVEERLGQVGQTLPKADRSGFVLVVGDRPNLGYRAVPAAEYDPVTILQAGNMLG